MRSKLEAARGMAIHAQDPTEQARREADREQLEHFRSLMSDGQLILGTLGFGLRIDRSVPTLAFDHRRREVLINPDFVERTRLSSEEKRYVFAHEISHFVQLVQDPDSYLETFQIAKEKASTHEGDKQQYVEQAWNKFFNVFLDIHDNAIVDHRSMWTQGLAPERQPRRTLYERLTSEDLQEAPKTEQFNFALLRKAMLGVEEPVRVDADVAEVIDRPFRYGGKTFETLAHFVREHFFDPGLPLDVFLSKLSRTLMPMFERFVAADVESGAIAQQTRTVELTGEDQDGDEIERIVDGIKRSRERGADRAARAAKEGFEAAMREKGMSDGEITRLSDIRERVKDVFPTLVDLWAAFLQTDVVREAVQEGGYVSGQDVDVDAFVREIPTLYTQPDRARFMERLVNEPVREREKPKAIKLYLVLDLSGSMDADKRQAVQEVSYALARSLIQYHRDKRNFLEDEIGDGGLAIDLRLIGFGDEHQDLFARTPEEAASGWIRDDEQDAQELETRLGRAVLTVGTLDMGGTQDAGALDDVWRDVSRADAQEPLESDDQVVVVIEVTDGETTTADASEAIVSRLNGKKNVFARAIRIPGSLQADRTVVRPDPQEDPEAPHAVESSGAFEQVWGKHGKELDDLSRLKEVMLKILFAALLQKEKGV